MLLLILLTLGGLGLLTVAADQFVIGAARLALALRISPVIVGAIVVGFGTSAPEMLVSALAAAQDSLDIAVANVAGSNMANVSLVLGVAAVISPMMAGSQTIRREAPLSMASVTLFAILLLGGLSRIDGAILAVCLIATLTWLARSEMSSRREAQEVEEFADTAHPHPVKLESLRTIAGIGGTIAGAQMLVTGATGIAERLGVAEGIVGLTLVAIGTSLPELATAVQAARRQQPDLVVGNVLGSNIFNSLAVGGIAGVVGPGMLGDPALLGRAAVAMVIIMALAWILLATGRRLERREGIALLIAYAVGIGVTSA